MAAGDCGVVVNEYLQSVSNAAVYAGGDSAATGGLPLTPVAGLDGEVIAANLREGNTRKPDYRVIPSVVFPFRRSRRSASTRKRRGRRGSRSLAYPSVSGDITYMV